MNTRAKTTYYYLELPDPQLDYYMTIPQSPRLSHSCQKTRIPDWAKLSCHQCSFCPLTSKDTESCPAAYDLIELVEHFSQRHSCDTVHLHTWTNSEMHTIYTNLKRALAYLYPIILAASSCPYASLLSPVRKFWKHFPDTDDVFFYTVSFDLLGDCLFPDRDPHADGAAIDMSKAQRVSTLLLSLLSRLRESPFSDANINALIKDIQWSYSAMHPRRFIANRLRKYFVDTPSGVAGN